MKALDRLAKLDRLTSLDAGFLALETPLTPMHVGSVSYLAQGPLRDQAGRVRIDELRRLVEERLELAPRFRQRPVAAPFGAGRPVWVDDPAFDVTDHVTEVVLPPPGSEHQLMQLCAELMMKPLERSRPLWELSVVDGFSGGKVVLVEKVHHVMMDGISGVDVAMLLTDGSPEAEHPKTRRHRALSPPGAPTLLVSGLADELGVPLATLGAPVRAGRLVATTLRHPSRAPAILRELEAVGRGTLSLLQRGTIAPRSPVNQPVGDRRLFLHTEHPITGVRAIAETFGCTLNDVVLAAVTGGLRRLLIRNETDAEARFQVAVPVSTRAAGDHTTLGNRVSLFLAPLPVSLSNPLAQLEAVRQMTRSRKQSGQASALAALLAASDSWPTPVVNALAHLTHYQPFANAVVTNVPGPVTTRYLLGSRIERIAPLAPLARNLDLSIGILSYDGEVSFGCYSDAEACPDLQLVAEGLQANLAALEALAQESRAPSS